MEALQFNRRLTPRANTPMFRTCVAGVPVLSLARSQKAMIEKYWHDAGLILWVETAQVGDTLRGWERIA